jgi:outer membrane receptor for ferrienterochelin and colicins
MIVPHMAGYVPKDEETVTKPFWDLGIRLAYEIHLYKHYSLEVNGGVKNVLDQFQPDLDKGPDRDANYIYGPTQPRTYFLGLALKL